MKKTVIVVGAGRGLGNHIAEEFAKHDFRVALIARRKQALEEYQQEFRAKGIETFICPADAADKKSLESALHKVKGQFGTADALVYNVGITTLDADITVDADLLVERYKVDVAGAYHCIQLIATDEFAEKNGAILLTGGKLATEPHFAYLPLSMDKAALRAMAYAMYPELKKKGIFIGMVSVMGGIVPGTHFTPERIAEKYWELYESRMECEVAYQ